MTSGDGNNLSVTLGSKVNAANNPLFTRSPVNKAGCTFDSYKLAQIWKNETATDV